MNLKYLAVITDIVTADTNNADEIVGFEDWKGARDFLEQAARDRGDLIGDTIESGLFIDRKYTYVIWEYDPENEGGDRFYRTKTFN